MEKSVFLEEVRAELNNIKAKATPEEIAKLNFERFDHHSQYQCIYGQMTGKCDSVRAEQLGLKIYDRVQVDGVCTSPDYNPFESQDYTKGTSYTALEKYLFMVKPSTHKRIINYLKNKTKSITLK